MPDRALLLDLSLVLGALGALGACASSEDYLIVTVEARPAVHDARSIRVQLSNAGTMRSDTLGLREQPFPVTFSISAPGRTGELAIAVDAFDDSELTVGHGSATTTVKAAAATVMLDASDFVVNTDYAGDQFPSDSIDAGGFQVAARPDGTWTTVFREGCLSGSCNVFARQFDQAGKPLHTEAAAGTNAFTVTTRPTTSSSNPTVASGQSTTLVLWNFFDVGTSAGNGIACRSIGSAGRLGPAQTAIDNTGARVVSVAAMADGNFVATWRIVTSAAIDELHMAILRADCTALGAVQLVAKGAAVSDFLHRGSVAASTDQLLFAWVTNGDARIRMASNAGVFSAADTVLVPQTQADEIESVRVVAVTGGGFVVGTRWAQKTTATGPGRLELYRVDPAGALVGTPILVSDKTGSDFDSRASFAMASRPDGTVLVAWHACGMFGDDSLCGVFGRILRATGDALTDAFVIPTNTVGDQQLPSVAALPDAFVVVWSDASMNPPDIAGRSVRARILYPP